ncbi:hypothetical protein TcasGA2_TC008074 [Tribolium castaneum]|uniref:Uncharacterized protein n=1 Tax=Tribolium castaneum TaxID=7070 RepID=D1ZZN2_TRICA|nr:hypothetical protein TcasGA2_TC008074 [Tribolium castaneum]
MGYACLKTWRIRDRRESRVAVVKQALALFITHQTKGLVWCTDDRGPSICKLSGYGPLIPPSRTLLRCDSGGKRTSSISEISYRGRYSRHAHSRTRPRMFIVSISRFVSYAITPGRDLPLYSLRFAISTAKTPQVQPIITETPEISASRPSCNISSEIFPDREITVIEKSGNLLISSEQQNAGVNVIAFTSSVRVYLSSMSNDRV